VIRTLPPLVLAALLLVSCGPDPLTGRVVVSGSATLAPLAQKAVEAWKSGHPRVESRVEAIGSDAGLERLIRYRDADVALVSRPLTDADRTAAAEAGLELAAWPVARDAVVLVVPAASDWVSGLSREQTLNAFTSAQTWADLDPSWPATAVHRFVLGTRSGTADVFAESVLGGLKQRLYTGAQVQASEDDQILARGVAQVPGAVGFLGWSTFQTAGAGLKALAFDGVVPSSRTIQDQSYGLPRTLWLVTSVTGLAANPAARSLLRSIYDNYPALTAGTGLVGLTASEREAVSAALPR